MNIKFVTVCYFWLEKKEKIGNSISTCRKFYEFICMSLVGYENFIKNMNKTQFVMFSWKRGENRTQLPMKFHVFTCQTPENPQRMELMSITWHNTYGLFICSTGQAYLHKPI